MVTYGGAMHRSNDHNFRSCFNVIVSMRSQSVSIQAKLSAWKFMPWKRRNCSDTSKSISTQKNNIFPYIEFISLISYDDYMLNVTLMISTMLNLLPRNYIQKHGCEQCTFPLFLRAGETNQWHVKHMQAFKCLTWAKTWMKQATPSSSFLIFHPAREEKTTKWEDKKSLIQFTNRCFLIHTEIRVWNLPKIAKIESNNGCSGSGRWW